MSSNTNIGNTPVNQGYVQLIHMGETGGIDGTLRALYDGDGTASDLLIASDKVKISTELYIGSKTLTEFVQDTVGAMFSSNTETNITVTYQDGDGTIDLVSSGEVTLTGSQSLTNKTLTSPVINTGISGTAILNEDNMASNSATKLSTQQSIKAYVDTEVAGIVSSAPSTLDTLNELAAALGDDANFSTTVTNSIATKLPLAGGQMTGNITFSGSQTVDGRDVSADGSKLDGIEASADVTDTANVTSAGALMDSEVDADIKTLSLPASTTISATAKTLLDDANVGAMRTTLGLGLLAQKSEIDDIDQIGDGIKLTAGESFVDSDDNLMTAAAIDDRINSAVSASTYSFTLSDGSNTQPIASGNTLTMTGSTGIDVVVGATDTATLTFDGSELPDMSDAFAGTDEFIVLDGTTSKRKAANEIRLTTFDDTGFSTITIDGTTANGLLTYGGTNNIDTESNLTFDGDFKVAGTLSSLETVNFDGSSGDTVVLISGTGTQRLEFKDTATGANSWIGIPSWDDDAVYIFGPTSSGNEQAWKYSESIHRFNTGTSEQMLINSNGSIALSGYTGQDRRIEIGSSRQANGYSYIDLIGDTTYTDFGARFIRENGGANTGTAIEHRGTGVLSLNAKDAGSVRFYTSNTERVRIDSSGNVGIGNIAPAQKLHVAGNVMISNNTFFMGEDADGDDIGLLGLHSNNNCYVGPKDNAYAGGFMLYGAASNTSGHVWYSGNAEAMRIDSSQRVGIGTASPNYTLQVDSNRADATFDANNVSTWADVKIQGDTASGNARGIYFDFDDDTGDDKGAGIVGISGDATGGVGSLGFITTAGNVGAERMRIASSGNVGIGTVSPSASLHINTTDDGSVYFTRDGGSAFSIEHDTSQLYFYNRTINKPAFLMHHSGTMVFNYSNSSAMDVHIKGTSNNLFFADASANAIGIGTSSPNSLLHIADGVLSIGTGHDLEISHNGSHNYIDLDNGNLYFRDDGDNNIFTVYREGGGVQLNEGDLKIPATSKLYLDGGGDTYITEAAADLVDMYVGAEHALRIADFGNTPYVYVPDNAYLGAGSGIDFSIRHDGSNTYITNSTGDMLFVERDAGNIIFRNNSGTERLKIDSSGDVKITESLGIGVAASSTTGRLDCSNDVVAYSTSDKRLKENIKPLDSALDKVLKISGVEFDWKELTEEEKKTIHGNEGHDVGVIAQEIEEVLPEVVTERDSGYKAVKYEKIVPLLIEAIKEQQKQIEELKNG